MIDRYAGFEISTKIHKATDTYRYMDRWTGRQTDRQTRNVNRARASESNEEGGILLVSDGLELLENIVVQPEPNNAASKENIRRIKEHILSSAIVVVCVHCCAFVCIYVRLSVCVSVHEKVSYDAWGHDLTRERSQKAVQRE